MENFTAETPVTEPIALPAQPVGKPRRRKVKESRGDRIYYAITYVILGILAVLVIYPLYFVVIASFSSADAVLAAKVSLYPVHIAFT